MLLVSFVSSLTILGSLASISYESKAARLPVIVEALKPLVGQELSVSPGLRDHVVVVRFSEVSADQALVRLAKALDAEWVRKGSEVVLSRTPAMERALRQKWLAKRTEKIQATLDALRTELDKTPTFSDADADRLLAKLNQIDARKSEDDLPIRELDAAFKQGPTGRAITRLLLSIPARDLAELPANSTTVFSNQPNRLQNRLGGNANDVLRDLVKDVETFKGAMNRSGPPNQPKNGWLGGDPRFMPFHSNDIRKALLSVTVMNLKSTIRVDLRGYDDLGNSVFVASQNLDAKFYSPAAREGLKGMSQMTQYKFSQEALEWNHLASLDYKGAQATSPTWLEKTSHPTQFDPLSFTASECLLALAKEKGKDLVADIGDNLARINGVADLQDEINLGGFERALKQFWNYSVDDSAETLFIKPSGEIGPPELPENRFAVEKLLQKTLAIGYLSLENLGEFAVSGGGAPSGITFDALRIVLPRSERIYQESDIDLCRLYGRLSSSQQTALKKGIPIPFQQAPVAFREGLYQFILNGSSGMEQSQILLKGERMDHRLESPLSLQPTEFLNSPASVEAIGSEVSSEARLLVGTRGGDYVPWTRSVTYAELLRRRQSSGQQVFTDQDDVWMGQTFKLNLIVNIGNDLQYRLPLSEQRYDLRSKPLSYSTLPKEIRDKIGG